MPNLPKTLEMVKTLVGLPSVSSVDPAVDQSNVNVIDTLAEWADGLGFDVECLDVPGSQVQKADLVATLGTGPGGLVLSGHTDTVPFDLSGWDTDPFTATERGDALYGLGTADMKSFLALALVAASRVDRARLKEPLRIVATADEECTMAGARVLARRGAPLGRFAVIGEPTSLRPIRMHKGKQVIRIALEGRSGHSSNPALGRSALDGMHEVLGVLVRFREELAQNHRRTEFDVPEPTMNLGCIHGGDAPNRICARCVLTLDLRPIPGIDVEPILAGLRERVSDVADRRKLKLDFQCTFGISPFETTADAALVREAEKATGQTAGAAAFATEAPFYQQLGAETVIVGPGSIDVAHQPNEHLPLASVTPTIEMVTHLIERFCLR